MRLSFMIRPATNADASFVAKCWKAMITDGSLLAPHNGIPVEFIVSDIIAHPFQIIDRTLKRRFNVDIVCSIIEGQEDKPVGFCETWTHADEPVAEFHKVYILPDWRGNSIAAQVCKMRMDELQSEGVVLFLLRVLSSPGQKHSAQQGAKLAKKLNMALMPSTKQRKKKRSVHVAHYFINVA